MIDQADLSRRVRASMGIPAHAMDVKLGLERGTFAMLELGVHDLGPLHCDRLVKMATERGLSLDAPPPPEPATCAISQTDQGCLSSDDDVDETPAPISSPGTVTLAWPHRMLAVRKARGWSQGRLGASLGVSQFTVSEWERGVRPPREDAQRSIENLERSGPAPARVAVEETPVEQDVTDGGVAEWEETVAALVDAEVPPPCDVDEAPVAVDERPVPRDDEPSIVDTGTLQRAVLAGRRLIDARRELEAAEAAFVEAVEACA